jgi:Site-specific recombinase XerD
MHTILLVKHLRKHERFMESHPHVKAWLQSRPFNTQKAFASNLERFCKSVGMTPEEWRHLDKFEARDLAWKYVQPKIVKSPATAAMTLRALKSWYRNLDGEQLPFDSGRGGKHHFKIRHEKRAFEHIPNKEEMYRIVDMASSLRDKAVLLFLFQSGVRVNVLEHLTYGDVQDQLTEEIIRLKITGDLDHKLRGRDIPFYYTFLNGEGAETLRQFCARKHKDSKPDTPLFYTKKTKQPIKQRWVWKIVKMCVERAGFKKESISTHTLRKAFRKIVRQTNIDDDDKEQLMGHVIKGSREAYFDEKDVRLIREAYEKCNFTREVPESNHTKMKREIDELQNKVKTLEAQRTALVTPQFTEALKELPKEQLLQLAANFQKMIEQALKEK